MRRVNEKNRANRWSGCQSPIQYTVSRQQERNKKPVCCLDFVRAIPNTPVWLQAGGRVLFRSCGLRRRSQQSKKRKTGCGCGLPSRLHRQCRARTLGSLSLSALWWLVGSGRKPQNQNPSLWIWGMGPLLGTWGGACRLGQRVGPHGGDKPQGPQLSSAGRRLCALSALLSERRTRRGVRR
jgi:hypothetical protein